MTLEDTSPDEMRQDFVAPEIQLADVETDSATRVGDGPSRGVNWNIRNRRERAVRVQHEFEVLDGTPDRLVLWRIQRHLGVEHRQDDTFESCLFGPAQLLHR